MEKADLGKCKQRFKRATSSSKRPCPLGPSWTSRNSLFLTITRMQIKLCMLMTPPIIWTNHKILPYTLHPLNANLHLPTLYQSRLLRLILIHNCTFLPRNPHCFRELNRTLRTNSPASYHQPVLDTNWMHQQMASLSLVQSLVHLVSSYGYKFRYMQNPCIERINSGPSPS